MAKIKKKNHLKQKKNYKNKINIGYKRRISTTIFLKFLMIIIFYNSISLTEEKPFEKKRLEDNSIVISMKARAGESIQILGYNFDLPSTIKINGGDISTPFKRSYKLTNSINTIILIYPILLKICSTSVRIY